MQLLFRARCAERSEGLGTKSPPRMGPPILVRLMPISVRKSRMICRFINCFVRHKIISRWWLSQKAPFNMYYISQFEDNFFKKFANPLERVFQAFKVSFLHHHHEEQQARCPCRQVRSCYHY